MKRDWRRALDIYVAGRNRALSVEQKLAASDPGAQSADLSISFGTAPADPTFGVSVPETLEFYRNAGTWRDRVDRASSGDSSAEV
jgi:hypothetical protein